MDNGVAAKFRKRAVLSATRRGFYESSEDLAHDVIVEFLEGGGQHQTIDQATVDAIRRAFGRPGTPGFERRRALQQRAQSMDCLENLAGAPVDRGSAEDFERIIAPLESTDRAIVCLIYGWGFQAREVANCFGVTESRISQRIAGIQSRLSQTVAAKELSPVEGVREEVETIRRRKAELAEELEAFLRAKEGSFAAMERGTDSAMEESQFWALEGVDEEGIPEWFA